MATPLPSRARLEELLTYEPHTGALRWKQGPGKQRHLDGQLAGTLNSEGYSQVAIDKRKYRAHRLIWMLAYGQDPAEREVDHIDGDRLNNRLNNLRLATSSQNKFNLAPHKGRDLPKGVKLNKGRFGARITAQGIVHWLGAPHPAPHSGRTRADS